MEHLQCKICGGDAAKLGSKTGVSKRGPFQLWHCPICHYSFVSNPWTDYQAIYTEAYYRGKGVDPMVDYVFELEEPLHSVRLYEWRGILARVGSLIDLKPETRWERRVGSLLCTKWKPARLRSRAGMDQREGGQLRHSLPGLGPT